MRINEDLNALQTEELEVIALSQSVDEVKAVLRLAEDVRHVQELQLHRLQRLRLIEDLVLNPRLWHPNLRMQAAILPHLWS